jgi:pimeloyl-ACP methyl ester carboxylesterase/tetratricopeptide (TPR) repeat protein
MPDSIVFIVPGVSSTKTTSATVTPPPGHQLKKSVTVTAQRTGGQYENRIEAVPGEDVVIIQIAGGPDLWLHPESARDLLLSQQNDQLAQRGGTQPPTQPGEVPVPARLQWALEEGAPSRSATRGSLGDVLVRAIHIFSPIEKKAADWGATKIAEKFDSQVTEGVYKLDQRQLDGLKGQQTSTISSSAQPSLVLIHGTFSETAGTYKKLWVEHPDTVNQLFTLYGNRVYALDHRTLGVSPISNALSIARAASETSRLHLLTHSRGGLVAEVLARVCSNPRASFDDVFAGNENDAKDLKNLANEVATKKLAVDRVVRVACPSRGTLLASKRLDAYVSVFKWALELAHIPVLPQLLEFLGEVARRRADPNLLPGLAAQIPDSPLIQWLHAPGDKIKGGLRVIAGDMQGDSVVTWIKTLLADAFYWTDNDLIVQTRSMYGGSPRESQSAFILDQGGGVSHFNYFSNQRTVQAIANALKTDDQDLPSDFREIGPLSWAGTDSSGVRAALVTRTPEDSAKLPALFILPGILGSNLKIGTDRIWLGWRTVNNFDRLAYDRTGSGVATDGLVASYYDDLATEFSSDHDVKPFAFDWRLPIAVEAKRLATAIAQQMDLRGKSGPPIRLIAHSMGGLVIRTMQIVAPEIWEKMISVDGSRILMLGTPNAGSWAPMQVLSGDDTFGNLLSIVGAPFRGDETRQAIADFPGFVQLQALSNGLDQTSTWQKLSDADAAAIRKRTVWHALQLQRNQFIWGVPPQTTLNEASKLWQALNRQKQGALSSFAHKLLLVVGKAPLTPANYELTLNGVVYLNAPDGGDGRVLLESALLPGVETWVVDADHGSLPRKKEAFKGYRELITTGKTAALKPLSARRAGTNGAKTAADLTESYVRSRPAWQQPADTPPQNETELLTSATDRPDSTAPSLVAALEIEIVNGDLTYISEPLLIGHYLSSRLTGAEKALDQAIGYAMSSSLRRGHYSSGPGTHVIFVNKGKKIDNPWQIPRPKSVIVAGLGAEGDLRGAALAETVRKAVIAWAQRLIEDEQVPVEFDLATTLLGSGGIGISAGQAAQLIARGVREANEYLADDGNKPPRWPRVARLKMIELYTDRANEAWIAVRELAAASPAMYRLHPTIREGTGALARPLEAGYRGADYDFISASVSNTDSGIPQINYTVNTKRARNDVRPQPIQLRLIKDLVKTAANSSNSDSEVGKTLFSLLIPVDLEAYLGSSTETVLELDSGTSFIPWEALETPARTGGDTRPWSIRTKLLRKMRASVPPSRLPDAIAEDRILVIGDPACDRSKYPKLFAARREATTVAARLQKFTSQSGQAKVEALISKEDEQPDTQAVINALMRQPPCRIIHIAGHGEPPGPGDASFIDPRGVVLGNSFLGPAEIGALRVIPELVFVNCCHLGEGDSRADLNITSFGRAQFASGVAGELINRGVRCVVAAGWAVDDQAASAFADEFYNQLLNGERFIDAVCQARVKAHAYGGNTWAAYQCYGDPDWQLRPFTGDGQSGPTPPKAQSLSNIALPSSLILALTQIAIESEFQQPERSTQIDRLRYLAANLGECWQRGDVAEAFGNAWMKTGVFEQAIVWYKRACASKDGTVSLVAIEQLANAEGRRAWQQIENTPSPSPEEFDHVRAQIQDATKLLDTVIAVAPTVERHSIYGSTYKRLALVETKAGRNTQAQLAIEQMRQHYKAAEDLARAQAFPGKPSPVLFYPAMNRIAAQLALVFGRATGADLDGNTIKSIRQSMQAAPPDFWTVIGETELQMYLALSKKDLASQLGDLIPQFRKHHDLVPAPRMWDSVYNNATFVLASYQNRANPREAEAAKSLLNELASMANLANTNRGGNEKKPSSTRHNRR